MEQATYFQYTALTFFVLTAVFTLRRNAYLISLIPIVAGTAYFYMITDSLNKEKYRYMDWAITTPLMLMVLLAANRFSPVVVLGAVVADLFMIYYGYKGTTELTLEKKKIDFLISCLFFLPVLYLLFKCKFTQYAKYLTVSIWLLYPVVWYVNETQAWSDTTTTSIYAVMDVCAKVGLVYLLQ